MDAVVFHIPLIFTRPSSLELLDNLLYIFMGFHYTGTIFIFENTSRCLFRIDSEKNLEGMGDEVKRETTIDNKIIFCKSELFLSFIENRVDNTPIMFRLFSEFEQRNTSFKSHISHEIPSRISLKCKVFSESFSEGTFSWSKVSSESDNVWHNRIFKEILRRVYEKWTKNKANYLLFRFRYGIIKCVINNFII